MKLGELLEGIVFLSCHGSQDIQIKGITYSSKKVKPGYIFVAIIGFEHDGHDFIAEAQRQGAAAVVMEREAAAGEELTRIHVQDARKALALLSARFYGYPSHRLELIGVTGTNGKTTTTYLIEAILRQAGFQTGLMGTVGNRIGQKKMDAERTTPEAVDIQSFLHQSLQQGVTHMVMEVSSHALKLKRVLNLAFNKGVYTNLSQDHLDFHSSLSDYLQVKASLFSSLPRDGTGIINMDDPYGSFMGEFLSGDLISYGIENEAQIRAQSITVKPQGASFMVQTPVGEMKFQLQLTGLFNVYNTLAAIGVGLAYHIELALIREALEGIRGVAGRFELVDCGQDFGVIVDYAHSPDGMKNILQTARDLSTGRTIIVFGCGGERDAAKRPLMGKVAACYGDFLYLTSDNPRREDPETILKHIHQGLKEVDYPRNQYQIIPDRKEAIAAAINGAQRGDMVFIIGKGHETYQILKDKTIPFDDREVARGALWSRRGKET